MVEQGDVEAQKGGLLPSVLGAGAGEYTADFFLENFPGESFGHSLDIDNGVRDFTGAFRCGLRHGIYVSIGRVEENQDGHYTPPKTIFKKNISYLTEKTPEL
jgi:hypothetical protein